MSDLRVYHGTNKKWSGFQPNSQQSGYYPGFYTTSSPDLAKSHGAHVLEFTLDPDRFFDPHHHFSSSKDPLEDLKQAAFNAGFPYHHGSGRSEAAFLASEGYLGLKIGTQFIAFDPAVSFSRVPTVEDEATPEPQEGYHPLSPTQKVAFHRIMLLGRKALASFRSTVTAEDYSAKPQQALARVKAEKEAHLLPAIPNELTDQLKDTQLYRGRTREDIILDALKTANHVYESDEAIAEAIDHYETESSQYDPRHSSGQSVRLSTYETTR